MPVALVVEDDENIRVLYKEALAHAGFDTLIASSVREAVKLLSTRVPDIAFVDMNMPEHPGTEMLAYLKGDPRFAQTKVVVVTANIRSDSRAEEYGVDLFLVKPVPILEMIQLAQRLIGMQS